MAFREMHFSLFFLPQKKGYYQRLAVLITDVHCWPTVSVVVGSDLLFLAEELRHLYFIFIRFYWVKELLFKARVRIRQKLLASWQSIDLTTMRVPDRSKYYFGMPVYGVQYKVPAQFIFPMPFILLYGSVSALQLSADDKACE